MGISLVKRFSRGSLKDGAGAHQRMTMESEEPARHGQRVHSRIGLSEIGLEKETVSVLQLEKSIKGDGLSIKE